jgi:hypothetical protein
MYTKNVEFLDPQKAVQVGHNVREAIREQMVGSDKVVIISSPNCEQSHWVNYEAGMASALGKPTYVLFSRGEGKAIVTARMNNVHFVEIDKLRKKGIQSWPIPRRLPIRIGKVGIQRRRIARRLPMSGIYEILGLPFKAKEKPQVNVGTRRMSSPTSTRKKTIT